MAVLYADLDALRASAADVRIVTSDGQTIAAHSYVLASASPVLETMIDKARRGWGAAADCTVAVLGVHSDAVLAFLHLLYSSRVAPGMEELVAAHGPQLLALAHAYRVGWLKRAAEAAVSARLTADRAVDMLKLARLCDAPRLYTRCARLAAKDFAAVEASDGWRFARRHDPALELELLQLLEDADSRRARWARARASQEAYQQLGHAMGSLDRIFADDDVPSPSSAGPAGTCAGDGDGDGDATCQGLRLLMRHFATCARKVAPGGCARCKRMLQLFRLHASVCDRPEQDQTCRVPLCSNLAPTILAQRSELENWAAKDFAAVEASDGWRFARRHDPALELELLQLLEDADSRRARWARTRASQEAYQQLGHAMGSLDRIFADDDVPSPSSAGPAGTCAGDGDGDATCQGLRLLMRHFATCARKVAPGGCARCKRMLQLFRLHASVCDRPEQDQTCRVPLCSHFTAKMQAEKADKTWRLLVKKVTRARAMAGLADREVPEVVAMSWAKYSTCSKWARN